MAFTKRILPPDEWGKLACTDFQPFLVHLESMARDVEILVVEDEAGEIVGCWGLFPAKIAHGLWVAPRHRKRSRVGWLLWQAMKDLMRCRSYRGVLTTADSPEVVELLQHVGAVPTGAEYMLPSQE